MKNDAQLAVEAAESMAKRLEEDVAIMMDLSTKPLKDVDETPLEIIRYLRLRDESVEESM
mgnify:CR=1 FL=1|tara:strand:+ start:592 stop:771 length:180 start_codon:yes stop_codon:yes gene_type:complete